MKHNNDDELQRKRCYAQQDELESFEFILISKLLELINNIDIIKDNYVIPIKPDIYTSISSYEATAELKQVNVGQGWIDLRLSYKSDSDYIEIWGLPSSRSHNATFCSSPISHQVYLYDPNYESLIRDILIDMWLDNMIRRRNIFR